MSADMRSGFMDATGVDPARMKAVLLTLVFAVILVIAAWLGKQILEAYSSGQLDSREVTQHLISVVTIVMGILVFVQWF